MCDASGADGKLVVISTTEYDRKLQQLLGLRDITYSSGIAAIAGDTLLQGDAFTAQRMALAVETFYRHAEWVASQYTPVSCVDLSAEGCGAKFIADFVEPLFERTLSATEREYYVDFFLHTDNPGRIGQQAALTAALSSPHFLFRKEVADAQ